MSTYVDGIGASQNIDSSGEIVDIQGLDISSLEVDGSLNWEHKKDVPDQLVGKVLKAKKIFSDKDCEDDRQTYFWNKCKTPYLYILGELFDEYTDSARTVAGLFRYDLDHRGKNTKDIVGFSVEGATINKQGNTITRSIARKITVTSLPCNKMAVAEMVPKEGKKPKDNLSNIFKTESYVDIEILDLTKNSNILDSLKKDIGAGNLTYGSSTGLTGSGPTSPSLSLAEPHLKVASKLGTKLGTTVSGKDVHSHAMVGQTGFNAREHGEAALLHQKAATANPKMAQHHIGKAKLHNSAAVTLKNKTVKKSEVLAPGQQSDSTKANQKQQRARRAEEAYPNNEKRHWDKKSINHSSSKISDDMVKRPVVPNMQTPPTQVQAGGPRNNMLHNNILAPKFTAHKSEEMNKALEAGSGLASPNALVGGAALAKESLVKPAANISRPDKGHGKIIHKPEKPKGHGKIIMKSTAYIRAEEDYAKWEKREEFENFMKSRMPHMTKSEIRAFGQAMLLNKSLKLEKTLDFANFLPKHKK